MESAQKIETSVTGGLEPSNLGDWYWAKSIADASDDENLSFHLSGMIANHRRKLGRVGKIETLPIPQICPRPSQTIGDIYDFEFSLVGKIWDSREAVKSPIVWDFPDIWKLGFSLVFICRENTRQSGILLFPDCPRVFRLKKTINCRYSRSSGMDGDKSGESTAFPFSRRVPDFCGSRRSFRQMKITFFHRGRRRWISHITSLLFAGLQSPYRK